MSRFEKLSIAQEMDLETLREQIYDLVNQNKTLDFVALREVEQRFPGRVDQMDQETKDEVICMVQIMVMGEFLRTLF